MNQDLFFCYSNHLHRSAKEEAGRGGWAEAASMLLDRILPTFAIAA
jgi:hypothetical protein